MGAFRTKLLAESQEAKTRGNNSAVTRFGQVASVAFPAIVAVFTPISTAQSQTYPRDQIAKTPQVMVAELVPGVVDDMLRVNGDDCQKFADATRKSELVDTLLTQEYTNYARDSKQSGNSDKNAKGSEEALRIDRISIISLKQMKVLLKDQAATYERMCPMTKP